MKKRMKNEKSGLEDELWDAAFGQKEKEGEGE